MKYAALLLMVWPLSAAADCVVLLHGLARSESSFVLMEAALRKEGYEVVRPGYESTKDTIEGLAENTLPDAIAQCGDQTVHFVTHSMGGILLRLWMTQHTPENLGRTVMLGPPNQGTELVDVMAQLAPFEWLNGPAGLELGTDGLPSHLPEVTFDLGVIAGNRSLNPFYSAMITGADDGKVSVESTKVNGMADHLVLPVTHTFMMNSPHVMTETLYFLEHGQFHGHMSVNEVLFGEDTWRDD
nr:alpha/beta fold hydrolase [uncultured Shimia sp.]